MMTSCVTSAARLAFLKGQLKPEHVYKIALYTDKANFDDRTKVYTPVNEVQGAGYDIKVLPAPVYGVESKIAFMDFPSDIVWANSTISAAGCMIFNPNLDNMAIAVVSFGIIVSSTNDDFTLSPSARLVRF